MTCIFVCSCGRRSADAWLAKVSEAVGSRHLVGHDGLCRSEGLKLIREKSRKLKADRILLAGCPALQSDAFRQAAAKAAGISAGAVFQVLLPPRSPAQSAARSLRLALAGVELTPSFEMRGVPLCQDVLVIGQGPAAEEAARQVEGFGHAAAVIEPRSLQSLEGAVGSFRAGARLFGAVIIACGLEQRDGSRPPFVPGKIIPLADLEARLAGLSRRQRPRSAAILLDLEIDEAKAGWSAAVRTALSLRAAHRIEVTIFQRDVRVSGLGLEKLYDDAREAGVTFIKFEGAPRIGLSPEGVSIACRDSVAGEDVEVVAGIAAVSPHGLSASPEKGLAEAAGVLPDACGRLQENNIHLLPEQTNRTGVFVVGPCRGEFDSGAILRDTRAAALAVHQLLSQKEITVELSHPVVDADKCVLCLTCIRSCPFKAMSIMAEEKRADCAPEACRRCGICAGECPARAITLPAYTDGIVLARAGVQVAGAQATGVRA